MEIPLMERASTESRPSVSYIAYDADIARKREIAREMAIDEFYNGNGDDKHEESVLYSEVEQMVAARLQAATRLRIESRRRRSASAPQASTLPPPPVQWRTS